MRKLRKITVIIPCYNEEKGVGKVIKNVPKAKLRQLGFSTEILVINNNSTDKTVKIASEFDIKLINEPMQGKGYAVRKGFDVISQTTSYVVILDGDNSYSAGEIPRLLEPLVSDFADVIIGSRLSGKIKKNSWKFLHRAANWLYTFFVRQFYQVNTTDVLSGYFAMKRIVIDKIRPHLKTGGFTIEMEMVIKAVRMGYEVYSVPITYSQREGSSKLNPFLDGIKILYALLRHLFWKA